MTINNLLNVKSRDELREWLMQNHDKEPECWVVVKRGRPVDDGTETVPEKAAQQLVGTEQGKMSQDGTARTDD